MDNPFKAAISVRKPDTVRYDRGLLQSPLRTPPLIREVVRVSANWLTEATLFARRNVGSTSPCFAIRLHTSADLPLMAEYLPNDVWRLISGTFTPKEMHILFSTCKVMQHYLEECIDKVEHQYLTTATDISDIANNHASTPKICTAKLKEFFDKGNCVGISLSTCTPMKGVIAAFAQSKSIELIRINANDIGKVISGKTLACLLDNLDGAAIELSLANNNFWSDLAFKKVFKSIAVNGSVLRLNLDGNNFRTFERSKPFFGMLFGRYSRLCTLSLAGSKFTDSTLSCLSDFGMSLLGFGLRFGLLSRLRSIDLANTSIQRRKMPFPEIGNNLLSDCIHPLAITHSYIDFCRYFLETKEESGLQVIIESLAANSTVTAIYLSHCGIDKKMTKVLAKSLQHNKTLKIIHLAENLIDNKGIKVLAKSIRQHPTLERLSLASNENIEQKGWIDFLPSCPATPACVNWIFATVQLATWAQWLWQQC